MPSFKDKRLFNSQQFERSLKDTSSPISIFRDALMQGDQYLKAGFKDQYPIADLVHARSWLVDQILIKAWEQFEWDFKPGIAMIAVGGYGRNELHPASDVDIMILLKKKADNKTNQLIESFLAFLWDTGLEVGHSVRDLKDCRQQAGMDITVVTNLMEARIITGPCKLFEAMLATINPKKIWSSKKFFRAKREEQIQRHMRYHDTAYNLEPNIKESPGGLRDIQMIFWVANRHFGDKELHELVTHHYLTEEEFKSLQEGQNFLWKIRFSLHVITDRREDRLTFDNQRSIAKEFGYRDKKNRMAVEQFMKDYYRSVMELSRLNEMLLQLFQEEILYKKKRIKIIPINKRFQICNDFMEVTNANVFIRYPFAMLEIFLLLQQYPEIKGVRASTIRLIRNHRHLIDDKFRNDLRSRSLFMEIMRQPSGVTHELRRMNRYGVLAAYLPAFGAIVGQMQHDLFHVYTVDEHILFVVRNLRRFDVDKFADEFPFCTKIIKQLPKPELLYLAGLFHDIAKGRGGDHSELGEDEALKFCQHHGLSQYDSRLVAWLVKHHLLMSLTAQQRDTSDPEVINAFAAKIGDQSHLDYLYLLTVGDIRATNPALWNSRKNALVIDLYQSTEHAVRRGLENPIDKSERIIEIQNEAIKLLGGRTSLSSSNINLWKDLGDDYFLRYSPDEIAWHSKSILNNKTQNQPVILIRQLTHRGGTEIFIYTSDKDYLFATITMVLDQLGLTILDARIITSSNGYTLDTFIVLERSGDVITQKERINDILKTLNHQLSKQGKFPRRISHRKTAGMRHFNITTEVTFQTDQVNNRTLMEVTTSDRPGLLSRVGMALAKCGARLQNAKIATFGERADDVFYITDTDNRPIDDENKQACLRDKIIAYLDEQAETGSK